MADTLLTRGGQQSAARCERPRPAATAPSAVAADASTPAGQSDIDLATRTGLGDRAAFAALFERHRGSVYRYARHMSGSPTLADDVVQDVFVRLLDTIGRFNPARASLTTYLYGVTRHVLVGHLRRQGRRERIEGTPLSDTSGAHFTSWRDPADRLDATAAVARVRRALLRLPLHQREVIVLCELHERSYEEAAAILDCPVGTVRSRLHRARAALLTECTQDARSDTAEAPAAARCWIEGA